MWSFLIHVLPVPVGHALHLPDRELVLPLLRDELHQARGRLEELDRLGELLRGGL